MSIDGWPESASVWKSLRGHGGLEATLGGDLGGLRYGHLPNGQEETAGAS